MNSLTKFLKQGAFALLGLGLVTAPAHAVNITTFIPKTQTAK
ncbi:MAG: hypothetical protein V7K73_08170 [Nostoc sp.]